MHRRAIALCAVVALFAPAVLSAQRAIPEGQGRQGITVREEKPGLLAQARIQPDSAMRVAMARIPNGTLREAEIEIEDGKLVYAFDFSVARKSGVDEVLVDARTGAIASVEHETPATEREEERAEKAKAATQPTKPGKP